jgi:hypothetical protein
MKERIQQLQHQLVRLIYYTKGYLPNSIVGRIIDYGDEDVKVEIDEDIFRIVKYSDIERVDCL